MEKRKYENICLKEEECGKVESKDEIAQRK